MLTPRCVLETNNNKRSRREGKKKREDRQTDSLDQTSTVG